MYGNVGLENMHNVAFLGVMVERDYNGYIMSVCYYVEIQDYSKLFAVPMKRPSGLHSLQNAVVSMANP